MLTILLIATQIIHAQGQSITITGTMIDNYDGGGYPGVTIASVDKPHTGTISDIDGNFSLTLPAGKQKVRISFLGYQTAELTANKSEFWEVIFYESHFDVRRGGRSNRSNQTSSNDLPPLAFSPKLKNEKDGEGVLYMKSDMPRSYNSESVFRIKDISPSGKGFKIKNVEGRKRVFQMQADFTTFIDFTTVGRLPKVQSGYAQGASGMWTDPALAGTRYSWGPLISDLQSEGKAVNVYSPTDFFRTGISFGNNLDLKTSGFKESIVSLSLGQKRENSPIPNAYKESYNASASLKNLNIGYTKTDVGVFYNSSYGKLTQQGSNMSTLMHSVFTTPPTFDNLNGLKRNDQGAWKNADGTYRTYSPGYSDNPYAIINESPDREKKDYLMTYLKNKYQYNRIFWENSISFDKLWNRYTNGTLPSNYPQRISNRKDQTANIAFSSDLSWRIKDYEPDLKLIAGYKFRHTADKLYTQSVFYDSDPNIDIPIYNSDEKLIRNSHEIKYGAHLNHRSLFLEVANKHYFSNTAHAKDYTNLFPEVGVRLRADRLLDDLFGWGYKDITLYGNIKRSIGEAALYDRTTAALSTVWEASKFRNYYEYQLPVFTDGLKPETYIKSEIGLRYSPNYHFTFELNGYNYNTHNLVSSVIEDSSPVLRNIGRIHSYGYFLEANYTTSRSRDEWDIKVKYTFSQGKSKATAIYSDEPFIRLGGFSDIATVFAKDEPLGTIYGSSYQRNGDGQIIMDNGYPMVNQTLTKIGDPTPDFIMTLRPSVTFKNFSLSCLFEYRHGGDRWNGTKAMMDYLGVSESTGTDRNIKQYIFSGVDMDGQVNTKAVDFYNPDEHIENNRWVRYGQTGVGEEYIEKASFLRLSDVILKYSLLRYNRDHFLKKLTVGFSAKNLFLITSYKGVDPSSYLFGNQTANGLDLFNLPSMRSYSFVVTLGF